MSGSGGAGGADALGGGAGADAAGGGGVGDAGAGGVEHSATFHWIEPTEQHRARAAAATTPALLRTTIVPALDTSVLIGTSTLFVGQDSEEVVSEAIVWTEASGTTGLGSLPGATSETGGFSAPTAISADGSTIVGRARNAEGEATPFRWTHSDGMEAIFDGDGTARAVSADGSVVLGEQESPPPRAFRWTRALGAVALEPVPGDDQTEALTLSTDGATVVGQSSGGGGVRLFVWTEAGGTRAVENLPGYTHCRAGAATFGRTEGPTVYGSCLREDGDAAFIWAGQDRLVALGPTDVLEGYVPRVALAGTADGSVAVGRAIDTMAGRRAFRWTEANGAQLIGLPDGYTTSSPVASRSTMSEDGSVVIGTMGGVARRSFLWSERTGTVVLSPLQGHDVSDVYAVSSDGSVAAGSSFRIGANDQSEDSTAVYWRADGVPHSIGGELADHDIVVGVGGLVAAQVANAPLVFAGTGSKDRVSTPLAWHVRLP